MIEIAAIVLSAAIVYAIGCPLIKWYKKVQAEMEEHDEHSTKS